jgi:hypothetical protein
MIRLKTLALAVNFSIGVNMTRADPLILACDFLETTKIGHPFIYPSEPYTQIDQIAIDFDKPSIELRVAKTIGTKHEVTFRFSEIPGKNMSCAAPKIRKYGNELSSVLNGNINGSWECGGINSFYYSASSKKFYLSELNTVGGAIFLWHCE